MVEVVHPIWLLKALALSLLGALLCGYMALCFLYYQGAWQFILHPTHAVTQTPESVGVPFTEVRFDASDTGQPRLTGWWVPAESQSGGGPKYAALTMLYLHGGSGSLSDTVPILALLHQSGINVFAIDYRGYGLSDSSIHPNDSRMSADATAALDYLTSTRHIALSQIIPYGSGLGAALASDLAVTHLGLPAVILDNPIPDPAAIPAAQTSRLIPARLLFGHQFDVAGPVARLSIPKLIVYGGPNAPANVASPANSLASATPSFSVTLPPGSDARYESTLSRFVDEVVQQHQ